MNRRELLAALLAKTELSRGEGVPDLGFGPMTEATKAGYPNAELRQGPPSMAERAMEYGSMPAQMTVDQFDRAGSGVADAMSRPSIANVANALFQSSMAVGRPVAALKALGGGYAGTAAETLYDAMPDFVGTAEAKKQRQPEPSLPGLTPEQMDAYRQAKDEGRMGAVKRLEEVSNEFVKQQNAGKAQAETAAALARVEEEQRLKQQHEAEYQGQVSSAEAARDKELARDRRFSETPMGEFFDKTGGAAAVGAGFGMGAVQRLGAGPANSFMQKYVIPGLEGAAAGITTTNLPLLYNGFFTEPDNPEKRAYEAYARELPPTHPRKQEYADFAKGLPQKNPVRETAQSEFFNDFVPRSAIAGAEGAAAAIGARNLVEVGSRAKNGVRSMLAKKLAAEPPPPRIPPGGGGSLPEGGPTPPPLPPDQVPPLPEPTPPPRPRRPSNPESQTSGGSGRKYDAQDNASARNYLSEVLDNGGQLPSRENFVAGLMDRLSRPIGKRSLDSRAAGTLEELAKLKALGVDVSNPSIRQILLDKVAPNKGATKLAIPMIGAGAASAMMDEDTNPNDEAGEYSREKILRKLMGVY